MTAAEIISYLRSRDVQLWLEDGRVRYKAPSGVISPALREELGRRREEILDFLRKASTAFAAPDEPIRPAPRAEHVPLSSAQQRLWFLDQLGLPNPAYNIFAAIRLSGELNFAALEQTLHEIERRHDVLRTNFPVVEGMPAQRVRPHAPRPLPLVTLEGLPAGAREAHASASALLESRRPFDLARQPLLRTVLLAADPREHVIMVTMHHIISDGWSLGLFIRQVGALYESFSRGLPPSLPEPPIQYSDYARWQRERMSGALLREHLDYWVPRLTGTPLLKLPTDKPRPPLPTYSGGHLSRNLPHALSASLNALGRREGATLFMTLLAAFKVLLSRYAAQTDIAVGTPIANRQRLEVEGLLGCFVNTLVLRTDLSGDPTFRELLGRVRQACLGAYARQDLPFELLVDELRIERDLSHNPLFQVMFAIHNAPSSELTLGGLDARPVEVEQRTAQFDLSLSLGEWGGQICCFLEYSTDIFEDETAARMLGHLETLLAAVAAEPSTRISRLPLLTPAEERMLLFDWNETRADYRDAPSIPRAFQLQARRTPDAVAVVGPEGALTYGELNRRATRLARHLRRLGVGPEVTVGVCMERSAELVVALLGVLMSGGAYVPVEPSNPAHRLAYFVEDARLRVVLAHEETRPLLQGTAARVVCLDRDRDQISSESCEELPNEVLDGQLAYVIYTSGSTGKPKGAMNTHGGIRNRLHWMQDAYRLDETDAVLQKTPFSFDVSVWEFFWPLMTGARLVVARPGGHRDQGYLARLVAEQQVTVMHFVPSVLQVFLQEEGLEQACRSLRVVVCSGEALPYELERRFYAHLGAELHNLYGPTEAAVDVTCWPCPREVGSGVVPIGRPISNIRLYLLDANLQPAPVGVPGELHIGGVGVGRGYLDRPALTAEKFTPDPFSAEPGARLYRTGDLARYRNDGSVEFLGRLDHQVKVRGLRLELGEVEATLASHPGVREAVVTVSEYAPNDRRLVAYLVPEDGRDPARAEGEDGRRPDACAAVREFLEERLPAYMIPSEFVLMEEMPLTPNGKVDRRALPPPRRERRDELRESFALPTTAVEEAVASVWREVLGVGRVGVNDNFFDLGGDSLLMIQVHARLRQTFGRDLSIIELFKHPTVGALTRHLGRDAQSAAAPPPARDGRDAKLERGKERLQLQLKRRPGRVETT